MSSAFVVQKHIVDRTAYTLMWTWLSTTGAIGVEPLFFILKFRLAMRAYAERRAQKNRRSKLSNKYSSASFALSNQ